MPRHELTPADRSKGGKARAAQPDFSEMCSYGYEMLKAKNYPAWLWVSEHKVYPHMRRKQQAHEACERSVMQQGQLEQHIGKRRPMKSSGTR